MLKFKQLIVFDGESNIDGKKVMTFRATIDADDPNQIRFVEVKHDENCYRDNREVVRADKAEFEDLAYSVQKDMLDQKQETTP